MNNPFSKITKDHVAKYSGKTIAVDLNTGEILECALSAKILGLKMFKNHPNVKYARITFK